MNRYIRQTVLLLAILFIPCVSFAANPKKYFEKISGKNGYDYSYVSPLMLKAMSEQYLSDDKVIQFELKTSDLTSIENITAESSENVGELKKLIPEIIKDNKMETLSTKKLDPDVMIFMPISLTTAKTLPILWLCRKKTTTGWRWCIWKERFLLNASDISSCIEPVIPSSV